jgi:hypothetical protein
MVGQVLIKTVVIKWRKLSTINECTEAICNSVLVKNQAPTMSKTHKELLMIQNLRKHPQQRNSGAGGLGRTGQTQRTVRHCRRRISGQGRSLSGILTMASMQQYKAMADDAQSMDMGEFMDTYSSVIDMAGDFWEDHQKTSESMEGESADLEASGAYSNWVRNEEAPQTEGNDFAQAVNKAKAAGMKPGDKFTVGDKEYTLKDAIERAGLQLETFFNEDDDDYEGSSDDYEGSFEYEFTGDDGEMAWGKIHYKAVNGQVDPNSLAGRIRIRRQRQSG